MKESKKLFYITKNVNPEELKIIKENFEDPNKYLSLDSRIKVGLLPFKSKKSQTSRNILTENLKKKKKNTNEITNETKEKLYIDSCGTSDYNTGSLPDYRMIEEAGKRNILLNHRARIINLDDLEKFDMIIVMDKSNYFDIVSMGADKNKVFQMINFVSDRKGLNEIPDPYYGYQSDFQLVLDLVYDGCKGILKYLKLI